uniref:Uncharacterized protein n=1 Tax=Glossina palpalis gambiensis TaxID=67801 RepID=A0A1B0AZJ7_9MUSC
MQINALTRINVPLSLRLVVFEPESLPPLGRLRAPVVLPDLRLTRCKASVLVFDYVAIGMQPGCMIMIIAIDLIGVHNAAHLSASMTSCQIDIDSFDKFHIGGSEILGLERQQQQKQLVTTIRYYK